MATREEIREGIRRELTFDVEDTEYWEIGNHFALKGKAITKLLNYLHSKDVAIIDKNRELPECCIYEKEKLDDLPAQGDLRSNYQDTLMGDYLDRISEAEEVQQDMLKAGYEATIPIRE